MAAFDARLRQSDAVRASLARRSGKAGCMTDSAMGYGKQGQGQASTNSASSDSVVLGNKSYVIPLENFFTEKGCEWKR